MFGRISELLLDVWIETNGESYVEAPLVNIEKTNWVKKGSAFLKAKFEKKNMREAFKAVRETKERNFMQKQKSIKVNFS